jgi:hypothetical protein
MFYTLSLKSFAVLATVSCLLAPAMVLTPPSSAQERQILTAEQNQQLITTAEGILELVNTGKYTEALNYLIPATRDYITSDQLKTIWEDQIIKNNGSFQEVATAKVIDVVNADIVILNVRFSERSENIEFIFNKDQKLVGMGIPNLQSIDAIATSFINNLATGEYGLARNYLSPLFKTEIFASKLEEEWGKEIKQSGNFKKIVDISVRPGKSLNEPDVAIASVEFERSTNTYFLFFNNQSGIVNVDFIAD